MVIAVSLARTNNLLRFDPQVFENMMVVESSAQAVAKKRMSAADPFRSLPDFPIADPATDLVTDLA